MLDKLFPYYALVFFLTLILTFAIEKALIPFLKSRAKQPIYQEGPRWHNSKSGTPTMGGLAFVIATIISLLLISPILYEISKSGFISFIIVLCFSLGNSLIGFIDDLTKLRKKENAGLTPLQKIILQLFLCISFLLSRYYLLGEDCVLKFAFGEINIGFFYYPLSILILLGIINSANLTDGIDGLASSVAFSIAVSIFYVSASLNSELSFIASALLGSTIGFLIFNLHPAKIFMGDTGSLFFGAIVASSGFMLENPIITLFLGAVYVIEGASVILQVLVFKLTGKRVFKMAPLHHHFEKSGFAENKICLLAMFLTFIASIPVYIFYLP